MHAHAEASGDDAQLGQQLMDFWTNICVCHSLISEHHPETGEPLFQVLFGFSQTHPFALDASECLLKHQTPFAAAAAAALVHGCRSRELDPMGVVKL